MHEYCQAYEQWIADEGGIDVVLCEIGSNGSIAFNEPGSARSSFCRMVLLSNDTRHNIAHDYKCDEIPTTAITLGIADIATKAGFASPKYFSKVFRQHFGKSPADFRNEAANNHLNT